MEINGTTIFFKSDPGFFELEENGCKPNTVRLITGKEQTLFLAKKDSLKHILITNTESELMFQRKLTDISSFKVFGRELWIFSFRRIHMAGGAEVSTDE